MPRALPPSTGRCFDFFDLAVSMEQVFRITGTVVRCAALFAPWSAIACFDFIITCRALFISRRRFCEVLLSVSPLFVRQFNWRSRSARLGVAGKSMMGNGSSFGGGGATNPASRNRRPKAKVLYVQGQSPGIPLSITRMPTTRFVCFRSYKSVWYLLCGITANSLNKMSRHAVSVTCHWTAASIF
jgi:hypothetical protein